MMLLANIVFAQYDKEVVNSLKAMGLDSVTYYKEVQLGSSASGHIQPMKRNWDAFLGELASLKNGSFVYIHGTADAPGSLERNYSVSTLRAEWIRSAVVARNAEGIVPIILAPRLNQDIRGANVILVTAVSTKKAPAPIVYKDISADIRLIQMEAKLARLRDDNLAFMSSMEKRLQQTKKLNNSLSERVRFGLGFAGSYGSVHSPTYGPSASMALPMFGVSYLQLRAYGLGSYEGQSGISLTLDANVRLWRAGNMNELYITAGATYTSYKRRGQDKLMDGGLYGGLSYNIPLGEYNVVNFTLAAVLVGDLDVQHQASAWTNQSVRPLGAVAFWF
jgi:hypothetical protein